MALKWVFALCECVCLEACGMENNNIQFTTTHSDGAAK